jgi:leader peptidase (prepilin peptidase) / N-methyltransferase
MELYYTITFFILGTILGSFLNVVIYRTPKLESIIFGRSHCTQCNHELSPLELIPILSFIMLAGKCKECKSKISIRYPAIELLTGILFLISYKTFGLSTEFIIAIPLILLLIIITMIDIDTMEINDRFQIGLLIIAIFSLFYTKLPIMDHLLGFFVISVPFYIIAILTEGIGGGDIKLIAIGGLLLGYKATLVAFFIAIILGSILAIYLLTIKKSNRKTQLAFGPFLCVGIYIAYHFSDLIIQAYLQLWF